ncbi:hypothetical protein ACA910_005789 [Epithemia clementina (nom. ined.)]
MSDHEANDKSAEADVDTKARCHGARQRRILDSPSVVDAAFVGNDNNGYNSGGSVVATETDDDGEGSSVILVEGVGHRVKGSFAMVGRDGGDFCRGGEGRSEDVDGGSVGSASERVGHCEVENTASLQPVARRQERMSEDVDVGTAGSATEREGHFEVENPAPRHPVARRQREPDSDTEATIGRKKRGDVTMFQELPCRMTMSKIMR